jgi:hypothetical protein
MAQGIKVQQSVPYVHTQNCLVESLIKRIKLIVRPLLHNCNLPITCWGHAVLHVSDLIQLQPTIYHSIFSLYFVRGNAFLICENLVVLYMYQFHHRNVPLWILTIKWVSMGDIIFHQL